MKLAAVLTEESHYGFSKAILLIFEQPDGTEKRVALRYEAADKSKAIGGLLRLAGTMLESGITNNFGLETDAHAKLKELVFQGEGDKL